MPLSFENSFRGKRVLVTGHTGFKGSWLVAWLHKLGAQVHGYALAPSTTPNLFNVAGIEPLLASHKIADIRDIATLDAYVKSVSPEVILHLAAQPIVRTSYAQPRETFETNAMGTVNVLDVVRTQGRPCVVVVVTSDKCYENREQVWGYRESDAMGGRDPYSASKGVTELIVASYRQSFFHPDKIATHGVRLASGRAGNVIGGGDWSDDRIMTDTVRCLAAGKPIPVRSPKAIRPWQHVLDPLSGYLTLAAHMLHDPQPARYCDGWNFGPVSGQELPVAQIVDLFVKAWGSGSWKDVSDPSHPHEARVLRLSIDKALWDLHWNPRFDVRQAISRTAAWYQRYYANPSASMKEACFTDIEAYGA